MEQTSLHDSTDYLAKLDALKNQLEDSSVSSSQKALLRYEMAQVFYEDLSDMQEALAYAERASEEAEIALKIKIHRLQGEIYFQLEDYEKALWHCEQALEHIENEEENEFAGRVYNLIGAIHTYQGNNPEALEAFEKSIRLNTTLENTMALGKTFFNLRIFLRKAMSISNMQRFYLNHLESAQNQNKEVLMAFVFYNLGLWHQQEHETDEALNYFQKALALKQKYQIQYELASNYYWIASMLDAKGETSKALAYYQDALRKIIETKEFEHIEMVLYALSFLVDDIQNEEQKNDIQHLIAKANELGFGKDEPEEDNSDEIIDPAYMGEEMLQEETLIEAIEEVALEEQQYNSENIAQQYQEAKEKLPESWENFAEIALLHIQNLKKMFQNAWFSRAKKKKNWEDTQTEIQAFLAKLPNELEEVKAIQKLRKYLQNVQQ